ncbi:uncharacterized protein DS421_7g207390 [Arachis hypogaea]|nr:uncharacterized protein DS421_7g207390 [Arachis hypogaea]
MNTQVDRTLQCNYATTPYPHSRILAFLLSLFSFSFTHSGFNCHVVSFVPHDFW